MSLCIMGRSIAGIPINWKRADYIQDSISFDSFAKNVSALAKERYVGFGVRMFENYCFKRVHTYTEAKFETYLADGQGLSHEGMNGCE